MQEKSGPHDESFQRALRVVGYYAAGATCWIVLSSSLTRWLSPSPGAAGAIEIAKALLFVVVTSALLLHSLRRATAKQSSLHAENQRIQEWLRAMADTTTDVVFIKDRQGRYVFVNRAQLEAVGKNRTSDVIGRDDGDLFPPEIAREIQSVDRQIMDSGETRTFTEWLQMPNGERRHLIATKGPIRDGTGTVVGLFGVVHNISALKRAEEQLIRLGHQNELILSSVAEGVLGLDEEGQHTFVNPAAARMLGYEPQELVGRPSHSTWHGERPAGGKYQPDGCRILAACRDGRVHRVTDETFRRKDGTVFPVEYTSTPIFDGDRVVGVVVTFSDVTEQRRAQDALRASEERFRRIAEETNDIIFVTDRAGNFTFISRAARAIAGFDPHELIGRNLREVVAPGELERVTTRFEETILNNTPTRSFEISALRKDGGTFIGEVNASRCDFVGIVGTIGVIRDISERKQAEQIQRINQAYLSTAVEVARLGHWTYNLARDTFALSDAALKVLGLRPAETGGCTMSSAEYVRRFIHPDDRAAVEEEIARARAAADRENFVGSLAHRMVRADGSIGHLSVRYTLETDATGEIAALFGIVQDISEQKKAEEALRWNETLLQVTLEASADGILSVDTEGRIIKASRRFAELWRIPPALLERNRDADLLAFVLDQLDDPDAFLRRVRELYASDANDMDTLAFKDGRVFERYSSPMRMDGRIVGRVWSFRDITDRRRAEEALQESLLFRREAEKIGGIGAWKVNPETDYLYWTEGVYTIVEAPLDYRPGLTEGLRFYDADSIPVLRGALERTLRDGIPFCVEIGLTTMTGRHIWTEVRGLRRLDEGGKSFVMGTFQDITARRQTGEALRQSEARFRQLLQDVPSVAIQGYSPDGTTLYWNQASERLYGYSAAEAMGRNLLDLIIPPEMREAVCEAMRGMAETGQAIPPSELSLMRKDGSRVAVYSSHVIVQLPGRPQELFCIDVDLSELKKLETEVTLRQQRLNAFFAGSTAGLVHLDADLRYVQINDALAAMNGIPAAAHIGRSVREVMPHLAARVEEICARIRVTGQPVLNEELSGPASNRPGETRHWMQSYFPIHRADGRLDGVGAIVVDVTDQKRAEEEAFRLATVIEQAHESVIVTDLRGTILYVNPATERSSGYSRAELVGHTPRRFKSGQHEPALYRELWSTVARGEVWTGHFVNRRKDGSPYEEDATISPVRSASGKIVNYVAIKRDVTEHMLLRQQLLQAQKMETIGQLAGGVAHDFNNLLHALLGYNEILLARTDPADSRWGDLIEVQKLGRRAADLTRQLLALGRKQNLDQRVTDINTLIQDLNQMLVRVLGADIRIEFDFDPRLHRVRADQGQIGQILLNLALNARDAMPRGGRLLFKTEMREFPGGDPRIHPEARAGSYVCIAVSDSGTGISPDVLQKLFEPFFTTKAVGQGTGLGLATSYGIARQHGGWIDVSSEVGQGSTFRIFLPAIERAAEPVRAPSAVVPAPSTSPRGTGQRILLVEDQDVLRVMIQRQLQGNGYIVTTAAHATEALAEFERNEFDLVLTDVVLPDRSGLELLDTLLAKQPDLLVLVSSGYTDNEKRWPIIVERKWPFVGKPYTAAELLAALHRIFHPDREPRAPDAL